MKGAVTDTLISQKNSQAIIYISAGTQITGISQFSNARIIKVATKKASVKVATVKISAPTISEQIVAKKKSQNQALKSVQEKINKKVKNSYYSSSQDNESLKFAKFKFNFAAVTTTISSFKYSPAFVSSTLLLNSDQAQLLKQKFYTSLSFLQFRKLRSSSLRGPPCFS